MRVGDEVTITGLPGFVNSSKMSKRERKRVMKGVVIHCCRVHFTLDNGLYRESFLFKDYPNLDREQRKRRGTLSDFISDRPEHE